MCRVRLAFLSPGLIRYSRLGRKVAGMQVGQPSRTAMAVARARAYHQVAEEPRVFTDLLALRIIGESALRDSEFTMVSIRIWFVIGGCLSRRAAVSPMTRWRPRSLGGLVR